MNAKLEVAHLSQTNAGKACATSKLPASLDQIYTEHFDFVWRNARRLGVPESTAEDVVQDVFLVIHRRVADFRGGPVRPWIFGILSRVVRDYKRTHRRKQAPLVVLSPDARAPLHEPPPNPSAQAERAERVRMLEGLLSQLDEDQRTLLVLFEIEQWTLREIAELYGTTVNTVYSRLGVAKQRLQKAYRRAVVRLGDEP